MRSASARADGLAPSSIGSGRPASSSPTAAIHTGAIVRVFGSSLFALSATAYTPDRASGTPSPQRTAPVASS